MSNPRFFVYELDMEYWMMGTISHTPTIDYMIVWRKCVILQRLTRRTGAGRLFHFFSFSPKHNASQKQTNISSHLHIHDKHTSISSSQYGSAKILRYTCRVCRLVMPSKCSVGATESVLIIPIYLCQWSKHPMVHLWKIYKHGKSLFRSTEVLFVCHYGAVRSRGESNTRPSGVAFTSV